MDYSTFGILMLTGFTACAEFGSYALVHPILRNLPPKYHIQVERGLLKTFGRVMPVLMTLCVIASYRIRALLFRRERTGQAHKMDCGSLFRSGANVYSHLQCAHQSRHGKMGSRQSTAELEGNSQQMGKISGD